MIAPRPWSVAVVVPARNESQGIGSTISSIRAAARHVPIDVSTRVIVVADSCTDCTEHVAVASLAGRGEVIVAENRSVGLSRSMGVARFLATHAHPLDRTWIANTDGDTVVPITWLRDQLLLADEGVTAVAGVVELDHDGRLSGQVVDAFRRRYAGGIRGTTHQHVHGANLGVRADAYLDVGGWAALETAEDHDLWARLRARGWPTRSSCSLVVTTSARRTGNAPDGFATGLQQLHDELARETA